MLSKLISAPVVKEIIKFSPTRIISILVGIFSFKFYTEIFSAGEYGIYNLILSTFSLITVALTGWIGYVLIRYYEKHKKEGTLNDFLSTILTVLLLILTILVLVSLPVLFVYFNDSNIYFLAFLGLPLTMISSLLITYYQLDQDVFRYNLINTGSSLGVFFLFLLLFKLYNLKLSGFFIATIVVNLSLIVFSYVEFRKKQLRLSINRELLVEYLRYGLPQIGTGIGVVLLSATSRYFIQYYQGSDAVGVFSAAFKFGELSILLPLGIFTSIFAPYVYRELELNGKQSAYASILKYSTLYLFFFGPIFILLFLFPKLPMILLGNNFESSLSIIPVICLANFFFGYAQFLAFYSQIDFKPMLVTIAILATSILSILLNILLIPAFGIFGSAYSIILAYLFYIILIVYLSKISVRLISLGGFLALAITALIYYKISAHVPTIESLLWVKILIGCSIWGVLALVMYLFGQFKSYKLA